jgi:hypothetical protein
MNDYPFRHFSGLKNGALWDSMLWVSDVDEDCPLCRPSGILTDTRLFLSYYWYTIVPLEKIVCCPRNMFPKNFSLYLARMLAGAYQPAD